MHQIITGCGVEMRKAHEAELSRAVWGNFIDFEATPKGTKSR